MIAAHHAIQRPARARMGVLAADGAVRIEPRGALTSLFRSGDLLVINDAATLPASLRGEHVASGLFIEARLASRLELDPAEPRRWVAVLLGAGTHRERTEDRGAPPVVSPGDRLRFGELGAVIERVLDHPRLVELSLEGERERVWRALLREGRPIQYAYLRDELALWDSQTVIAGPPVAVEPPSAGFVLTFAMLAELRARGVEVATLTHAAGLSSTGDAALDARLPLPEPYEIPARTAVLVRRAHRQRRRVIALGTTVARALESASRAGRGVIAPGRAMATLRLGSTEPAHAVDVLVTGVHESGTSHHELLAALVPPDRRDALTLAMEREGLRTHEFGDSCWVERASRTNA